MSTYQQEVEWRRVLASAGPYPIEAFEFVRDGLGFCARKVHGEPELLPEMDRHVSGQQLCLGLREYAIERYGLLAPVVLEHWNVQRTDDFGRIVFTMIDAGLMSSTADDSMDDFRGVYDFDEAFSRDEMITHMSTAN